MSDMQKNRDTGKSTDEKSISLLDLIFVIVSYGRFIILMTLLGAIFIIFFSIYTIKMPQESPWNPLPDFYKSVTKIQINEKGSSATSLSSMVGGGSDLGALLLSGSIGGESESIILTKELLFSNNVIDTVIKEFNILDSYRDTKFPLTSARDSVKKALQVETSGESGPLVGTNILYLSYKDLYPSAAADKLEVILIEIEKAFRSLTLETTLNKKIFIEERLESITSDLEIERDKFFEFQKKHGIIDISTQARQQTNIISSLREDIVRKELELQTLKSYLAADDPKIVRMMNEIDQINLLIKDLKNGTKEFTGEFLPQDDIPELTTEYLTLKREVAVLESIYTLLRNEYEMVKIEETDNSKVFQVIQALEIPEMKAGPSRRKLCIFFALATFFFAVFLSFVREYFKRVKSDHTEAQKLINIKNTFHRKRKSKKE